MPAHLIAEEGPLRGLLFNLETGTEWIIGRDPDESQFIIEDDAVSRKAARLRLQADGVYIENLSRVNPILVNDEKIEMPVLLQEEDRIQIGHTVFIFSTKDLLDEKESLPREKNLSKKREGKIPSSSSNDTIFEDLELESEESSLPFNPIAETPFLLKVISGPNAGAEIDIEAGKSYLLGKDSQSCDIAFQDLSVSRNHARITVDPNGKMEIEDLGSKNGTAINGSLIVAKTPLTTNDMVAIGTTVFLLIDREAPQETIYSPIALPSYEPHKIETPPSEQEAIEEIGEGKKDWKRAPIPGKYLITAASFAATFLIVFLSFFSLFKSKPVDTVRKEPLSRIQNALEKYEDIQFSFNPASGKLFLVGHVLTAVDAEEMRFRIAEIDFVLSVEDNTVIDEYVDRVMNDILSSNPSFRGVVIQSPQAGRFIASGNVETNAQAAQLSDYLAVNFPYLDRLENKVVIAESLNAQISALLQAKGFSSLVFQYTNGEVTLSGNYSNKMDKAFKDLIKQIGAIKGVAQVKNYAVATKPSSAAIDISNQYQLSGVSEHEGKGYSAILNGKIYTVGNLVSGMTIIEIDPTMILLEKDGIKYKINYVR